MSTWRKGIENWVFSNTDLELKKSSFHSLVRSTQTEAERNKQMLSKWYWASDNKVIFNEQNWWKKTLFAVFSLSNFHQFVRMEIHSLAERN